MPAIPCKAWIEEHLAASDIRIDGTRPWDVRIHDARFFRRVALRGSLGLGEAYMDGWWDVPQLDGFFFRLLRQPRETRHFYSLWPGLHNLRATLFNLQRRSRAFQVGRHHYDLGNDLYRAMLDRRMVYSCGYWRRSQDLETAQEAKLDLCCRKLGLQPGHRVLDIGCGWGGFARYAAEHTGAEVVGITVSPRQAETARALCRGLPVDIRLQDYRDLHESFDRIVSIGMFEHVGVKNYATFMNVVRRCLRPSGLFLLHTIGGNRATRSSDPWLGTYIFPNSMLPSPQQLTRAAEPRFILEDWHNFGPDYDRTLLAWLDNIQHAWSRLPDHYDTRFQRMWIYYLASCAGAFRARRIQLWQLILSPRGRLQTYHAPR